MYVYLYSSHINYKNIINEIICKKIIMHDQKYFLKIYISILLIYVKKITNNLFNFVIV